MFKSKRIMVWIFSAFLYLFLVIGAYVGYQVLVSPTPEPPVHMEH
jgi:hypothetical protein